jgi:23S rRNA pseudouridine955/2504/2580 synthase
VRSKAPRPLQIPQIAGQRLDNFLFRHLKGVPKTHVYRIIRSGEVRINKGRVQAETRIEVGDVLQAAAGADFAPRGGGRHATRAGARVPGAAGRRPPAGHRQAGRRGGARRQRRELRRHRATAQARPGAKFLELVHRLDRETSGVLLVAKKRSALTRLQDQFRERETGKTYLALVVGAWPANKKVLDAPLHKYLVPDGDDAAAGERRVKVVAKDDPDGMRSITLVKVLARRLGAFTLLEVTIKTGRTHQIRVHLASQGHPIAGDDKYGDFELNKALQRQGLKRMFLHAWRLQFQHPATAERIALQAPFPPSCIRSPIAAQPRSRHD